MFGGSCQFDSTTNLPNENCHFFPDGDNSNIKSSLMAAPFLSTLKHFCKDTETVLHHDIYKPNKQNFMCGQKSTWEIIRENEDFQMEEFKPRNVSTNTTFTVVQPELARFTLVLDRSTSMQNKGRDRFKRLKQSSKRWIQYELKTGSKLGIVSFW